jgi:Ca-activated chloride channel homolog
MKRLLGERLLWRILGGIVLAGILSLVQAQTYVQLVLDASGSMWNKLDDGTYRISAAKNVLGNFIKGLPEGELNVGLRVYGATKAAMDEGSCEDIALVVPMDGVDKPGLQTAVDETTAKGATPIVKALELAAADFPANAARKLIVLVTDGEESCGGDLNAVAEKLKAQGIEIDLKIIGFALNEDAQKSFEGVGEFVNAADAGQLASALDGAVEEVVVEEAVVERQAVTLTVPATAPAGQFVDVAYAGADLQETDYLTIVPMGAADDETGNTAYIDLETKKQALSVPFEAGDYEVRYLNSGVILARAPVRLEPSSITMQVTGEVRAGGTFEVEWTGPDGDSDVITLVKIDTPEGERGDEYTYTASGNPLEFTAPLELGSYELRYQTNRSGEEGKVFARVPVEVLEAAPIFLQTEPELIAGSAFDIEWAGPANEFDIIAVSAVGADADDNLDYHYIAEEESPTTLTAPVEPGDYDIRYINNKEYTVLATIPTKVVGASVSLSAPGDVVAGGVFEVEWVGPGNEFDVIDIASPGADATDHLGYGYVANEENPFPLTAPSTPGDYEVRYINNSEEVVLTSVPIRVTASDLVLQVPSEHMAGDSLEVTWTGTTNDQSIVAIVASGASDEVYDEISYTYTSSETSAILETPFIPGDYEVRIVFEETVLARSPITLTEPVVTLEAPSEVAISDEYFEVDWTGPENDYSRIALIPLGSDPAAYEDYEYGYAGDQSPGSVGMYVTDLEAGRYELLFLSPDGKVLQRRPITLK